MKSWLILFLFLPFFLRGQNFVDNSSFESYVNCPSQRGSLTLSVGWFSPQYFTDVEYFNVCGSSDFRIPNNVIGYQYALDGSAYIGCYLYVNIDNHREYIAKKINSKLVDKKIYILSFYVSLANQSKFSISKKSFQVFFSADSIAMSQSHGAAPLPYSPQVFAGNSTEILNDTANWTKLTFYYQAQGGEEYIYIGNFNNDDNTVIQNFNSIGNAAGAYYYIDEVSLVEVPSKDASLKDIKKRDSCYTAKDTLWVQLQNRGVDSLNFIQAPLPYLVEVSKNGNVVQSFVDSIQTNQYNTGGLPLPLDSSIWFPIASINLSDLGKNYQINIELQWALDEDSTNNQIDTTFNTDLLAGITEISDDTLCFGDEVQLTTANYKGAIQWQSSLDQTQWQNLMPGDTVQHKPTQKTHYRLAVCDTLYSDTFEVEVLKPNLTILDELKFCSVEQTINIKNENTFSTLRWYSDSNSNSFFYEGISLDTTLKVTKTFYLAAVLNGCESEERVPLKINISCDIKIPNVFTPNGDGINDLFLYRNVDESKTLQTKIYNRWGDVVSQWSGNKGWNGEGLNEGVYYYEVYYGKEKITGVVSLIRD